MSLLLMCTLSGIKLNVRRGIAKKQSKANSRLLGKLMNAKMNPLKNGAVKEVNDGK